MFKEIMGIKVHYEQKGNQGVPLVLLHGWGQNTEMMAFIADYFADRFRVLNLDFPGFGQSQDPPRAFSVEDYADWLYALLQELKMEEPILVAHSFGCRVALHYARKHPVRRMALTGAAGVRDKRGLKYYLKTYSYKLGKKIMVLPFLKNYRDKWQNRHGSADYRNASGVMRQTLVKVVNDDVSPFLKDINVETLLIFGSNDAATPIAKGEYMASIMPDATLIVFENDDHYAYFHQAERFNRVLDAFLRRDYA